jgi:hypothetical protein
MGVWIGLKMIINKQMYPDPTHGATYIGICACTKCSCRYHDLPLMYARIGADDVEVEECSSNRNA